MGNDKLLINESDLTKEHQGFFLIQSETLSRKFTSRRINFYSCINREAAQEQLVNLICDFKKKDSVTKIGFADSVTLHQLNVFEIVDNIPDIEVINPFKRFPDGKYEAFGKQPPGRLNLPQEEYYALVENVLQQMRDSLMTDIFITGTNAITMNGQIVSIDGTGNRVAGMIFGPKKVIILVGRNKVVREVDEAIKRIRNVAAPLNFIRHNNKHHNRFDTPCLKLGYCTDCNHPRRACLNTVIIDGATEVNKDRLHLILVNDILGL